MRIFPIIATLATLSNCLAATNWVKIYNERFEVYTSAGEKRGKEILRHFETVRSFFVKQKISPDTGGDPVRIVLFRNENDYKPYRANEHMAAYFMPSFDRDYIVIGKPGEQIDRVVVHEYIHLLLKEAKFPLWLNEGLAEVFSTLRPMGKGVRAGEPIPAHFVTLQNEKWLDLPTLFTVDHKSAYYNEKNRVSVFYAESWALAHTLLLGADYQKNTVQILSAIANGTPAAEAITNSTGKTMPQVTDDVKKKLHATLFNVAQYNVQLDKSAEEPQSADADSVEIGVALGQMQYRMQQPEVGKTALLDLAKANPGRWEPWEALAYTVWAEKKHRPGEGVFRQGGGVGLFAGENLL